MYRKTAKIIGILGLFFCVLLFSNLFSPVLAKEERTIVVDEVTGNVYATFSGSVKEHVVYEGMKLKQGDYLRTTEGSTITLKVSDRKDVIFLDQNAELSITELANQNNAKQTKLTLWVGTVYLQLETLLHSSDTFELLTTNTALSARGTHFTAGVDRNGDVRVLVASGVVRATPSDFITNSSMPKIPEIYPTQEAFLFTDTEEETLSPTIVMLDPSRFVEQVSEDILKKIIMNRNEIEAENEEQKDRIQEGLREQGFLDTDTFGLATQQDLNRLNQNLDYLIDNIVKTALDRNQINRNDAENIIQQINKDNPERPIDLSKTPPLEPLQGASVEQRERMLEEARQRKEQQVADEKRLKEQVAEQNRELLDRLEQQKRQQEEANQRAVEEAKQQAEERYKQQLQEEERRRFEEAQRQREEERRRAEQERQQRLTREQQQIPSPPSSGGSGTVPNITKIIELEPLKVALGVEEFLPASVQAQMSNNSTRMVPVNWTSEDGFDVSKPGIYTFIGKVIGYEEEIPLEVHILANYGSSFLLDEARPVIPFENMTIDLSKVSIPDNTELVVTRVEAEDAIEAGLLPAGEILNFAFSNDLLGQPVELRFELIETANSENIGVFYKKANGVWLYETTTVENNNAIAVIEHFSTFGVFEAAKAEFPVLSREPGIISADSGVEMYYPDLSDYLEDVQLFYQNENEDWVPFENSILIGENGWRGKVKGIYPNHLFSEERFLHYTTIKHQDLSYIANENGEEYYQVVVNLSDLVELVEGEVPRILVNEREYDVLLEKNNETFTNYSISLENDKLMLRIADEYHPFYQVSLVMKENGNDVYVENLHLALPDTANSFIEESAIQSVLEENFDFHVVVKDTAGEEMIKLEKDDFTTNISEIELQAIEHVGNGKYKITAKSSALLHLEDEARLEIMVKGIPIANAVPITIEQGTGTVTGTVYLICPAEECDEDRPDPLENATVKILIGDEVIAETLTDQEGSYLFHNVPANTDFIVEVTFWDPYEVEDVTLVSETKQVLPNESKTVDVEYKPGLLSKVTGMVMEYCPAVLCVEDQYLTKAGAIVKLKINDEVVAQVETNQDGEFIFRNIPPGIEFIVEATFISETIQGREITIASEEYQTFLGGDIFIELTFVPIS